MTREGKTTNMKYIGSTICASTGALTGSFIILKLFGEVDWSWWWVFAPLWMPAAAYVVVVLISLAAFAYLSRISRS